MKEKRNSIYVPPAIDIIPIGEDIVRTSPTNDDDGLIPDTDW